MQAHSPWQICLTSYSLDLILTFLNWVNQVLPLKTQSQISCKLLFQSTNVQQNGLERSQEMSIHVNWPQSRSKVLRIFKLTSCLLSHIIPHFQSPSSSPYVSSAQLLDPNDFNTIGRWTDLILFQAFINSHSPSPSSHMSSALLLVANEISHWSHWEVLLDIKRFSHVVHSLPLPFHPLRSRTELQQPLFQGVHSWEAWKICILRINLDEIGSSQED